MSNWTQHYQNTKNYPPPPLLVEALSFVAHKSKALDLGAGALTASKYLLSIGFDVTAVDKEPCFEQIPDIKFSFIQSSFKDFEFPKNTFDLISSQYALPFNGVDGFSSVWTNMISSLTKGGIFVGQLFSTNDEWNVPGSHLIFHSKSEVQELLKGLEILKLQEVEKGGTLANGTPKHWHLFNIIAQG